METSSTDVLEAVALGLLCLLGLAGLQHVAASETHCVAAPAVAAARMALAPSPAADQEMEALIRDMRLHD